MVFIPNPNSVSLQQFYGELKERVRNEGVSSYDAYIEMVDSFLQEKKSEGLLGEDENIEYYKDALESRWNEIQND